MTISIDLTPEEEVRLRDRAYQKGRDLRGYVHDLITSDIAARPRADVDEALAPFHRQVETSGLSDAELEAFFEDVREEVWQEKQGTLPDRDS